MIHEDSIDLMVRLQRHLTRDLRSERSHENLIYLFCNYGFSKCDFCVIQSLPFHNYWTKSANFMFVVYFWASRYFYALVSIYQ